MSVVATLKHEPSGFLLQVEAVQSGRVVEYSWRYSGEVKPDNGRSTIITKSSPWDEPFTTLRAAQIAGQLDLWCTWRLLAAHLRQGTLTGTGVPDLNRIDLNAAERFASWANEWAPFVQPAGRQRSKLIPGAWQYADKL